jgi:hypothetical protein
VISVTLKQPTTLSSSTNAIKRAVFLSQSPPLKLPKQATHLSDECESVLASQVLLQKQDLHKESENHKSLSRKNATKEFFHYTVAEIYDSSLTELTPKRVNKELLFSDFVEPTLAVERARVSRGEFSKASFKTLENRLFKTIVPFFKDRSIKDVGYSDISRFVQLLSNEQHSNIMIHQYLVCVRKVLNHAYETDVIQQIPKFPSIKMPSVSRGSFSLSEYKSLVKTAKNLIGTRSKKSLAINESVQRV